MEFKLYKYPIVIKPEYLDVFGHVNNATYLVLFEEARWDLLNKNNYGIQTIQETNLGPTILEIHIKYLKEIRLGDDIIIHTQVLSYERKIAKFMQKMLRGDEECCVAEYTIGLFDLKARRLVLPTPEWLKAIQ